VDKARRSTDISSLMALTMTGDTSKRTLTRRAFGGIAERLWLLVGLFPWPASAQSCQTTCPESYVPCPSASACGSVGYFIAGCRTGFGVTYYGRCNPCSGGCAYCYSEGCAAYTICYGIPAQFRWSACCVYADCCNVD